MAFVIKLYSSIYPSIDRYIITCNIDSPEWIPFLYNFQKQLNNLVVVSYVFCCAKMDESGTLEYKNEITSSVNDTRSASAGGSGSDIILTDRIGNMFVTGTKFNNNNCMNYLEFMAASSKCTRIIHIESMCDIDMKKLVEDSKKTRKIKTNKYRMITIKK
jgi:hypothetical protein